MHFDADLEMYIAETDGILFALEEPAGVRAEDLQKLADSYWDHWDSIINFMLPDLTEIYGKIDVQTAKEKLGQPTIYPESGVVDYFEQSFDDMHVFRFEFLDDAFQELQYFQIDG